MECSARFVCTNCLVVMYIFKEKEQEENYTFNRVCSNIVAESYLSHSEGK